MSQSANTRRSNFNIVLTLDHGRTQSDQFVLQEEFVHQGLKIFHAMRVNLRPQPPDDHLPQIFPYANALLCLQRK